MSHISTVKNINKILHIELRLEFLHLLLQN